MIYLDYKGINNILYMIEHENKFSHNNTIISNNLIVQTNLQKVNEKLNRIKSLINESKEDEHEEFLKKISIYFSNMLSEIKLQYVQNLKNILKKNQNSLDEAKSIKSENQELKLFIEKLKSEIKHLREGSLSNNRLEIENLKIKFIAEKRELNDTIRFLKNENSSLKCQLDLHLINSNKESIINKNKNKLKDKINKSENCVASSYKDELNMQTDPNMLNKQTMKIPINKRDEYRDHKLQLQGKSKIHIGKTNDTNLSTSTYITNNNSVLNNPNKKMISRTNREDLHKIENKRSSPDHTNKFNKSENEGRKSNNSQSINCRSRNPHCEEIKSRYHSHLDFKRKRTAVINFIHKAKKYEHKNAISINNTNSEQTSKEKKDRLGKTKNFNKNLYSSSLSGNFIKQGLFMKNKLNQLHGYK